MNAHTGQNEPQKHKDTELPISQSEETKRTTGSQTFLFLVVFLIASTVLGIKRLMRQLA